MSVPQQPGPPVVVRPRRVWWVIPLAGAIGAALAVGVVLVMMRPQHSAANPPVTAPVTVTAAATTSGPVLDADQQAAAHRVDAAVAMDGVPVDWAQVGTDAYGFVSLTCEYLTDFPGGPAAVNWYKIPIPGVMTPGGMAALTTGAPIVCPQLARFIATSANAFFPG